MRSAFFALAALLGFLPPTSFAKAEGCFGGITCQEAADAAISFKLARDCAAVIAIDPAKRNEFEKALYALRHRPLAETDSNEFSDAPKPRSASECDDVGKKIVERGGALLFMVVRPEAAKRLRDAK